mmetsp:Transcript_16423/g.27833  ORF Transcript_16423/g.27833 Transcript_16423/m.27833 type:complete len:208 (-) Transcript_16423:509-1132(-)
MLADASVVVDELANLAVHLLHLGLVHEVDLAPVIQALAPQLPVEVDRIHLGEVEGGQIWLGQVLFERVDLFGLLLREGGLFGLLSGFLGLGRGECGGGGNGGVGRLLLVVLLLLRVLDVAPLVAEYSLLEELLLHLRHLLRLSGHRYHLVVALLTLLIGQGLLRPRYDGVVLRPHLVPLALEVLEGDADLLGHEGEVLVLHRLPVFF